MGNPKRTLCPGPALAQGSMKTECRDTTPERQRQQSTTALPDVVIFCPEEKVSDLKPCSKNITGSWKLGRVDSYCMDSIACLNDQWLYHRLCIKEVYMNTFLLLCDFTLTGQNQVIDSSWPFGPSQSCDQLIPMWGWDKTWAEAINSTISRGDLV